MDKEERYISVEQSIIQACHEVNLMRAGLKPKRTLNELWEKLEKELDEDELQYLPRKAVKKA
ncbi:MAG: hypothetical protein IJS29_09545 [Selenomonadaceae bacterium]|nr:hypothetical protein [Selenomonadaceae bacterium]